MRCLIHYKMNGNIGGLRRKLCFYFRYYLNPCNQCINFKRKKYIFFAISEETDPSPL